MPDHRSFSIEPGVELVPFWRRFPSFFVYPLQLGTLVRLAVYSVLGGIGMLIPGVFGKGFHLVVFGLFLAYALMVLGRTANGRFDEPDGLEEKDDGALGQVLRQLALLGIMGMLETLLRAHLGDIGEGLGWLLTSLLTPAGIMIIAAQRSMLQALHPGQIAHFVKTIGSPYLALCFILFSLDGSGHWVQGFLYRHMHSLWVFPLFSFAGFYFALITYHMMGYAMYQYHEDLDLRAAVSFDQAQAKIAPAKVADPVLAQLAALLADGHEEAAIDLLRDELRRRWENNELHARYQKLLLAAGKHAQALPHAREFIYKLASEKRMFQALDLCEQWLKLDTEFRLQDPDQALELATAAAVARRHRLALDLMRDFETRYPRHAHIPALRLLRAKILWEQEKRGDEARLLLESVQADYPGHAAAEEARLYLQSMSRLAEIG